MRHKLAAGWVRPGWINYLLLPLSWLYIAVHGLRALAFRTGLCSAVDVGVPVIVVGALTVGGSGKTPLVIALSKHLKDRGYRPGVIARGYRGQSSAWPQLIELDTPVSEVGDEALLIRTLSKLPVAVGPNRVQDARLLIEQCDCDVIVSDDGFQHFMLARDLNIVVIDGHYGYGNGWYLPAGPLRESIASLKRADIVVENGSFGHEFERVDHVMKMQLLGVRNLADGRLLALTDFLDSPVHAVAALGNPERFFGQLEEFGLELLRHQFPDHYYYRARDLAFGDELPVLMTEKDAVKCTDLPELERLWVVTAHAVLSDEFYAQIERRLSSKAECRETLHE